jgi:hypothetical protein
MWESVPSIEYQSANPCFYFAACGRYAALEKCGKSLCCNCGRRFGRVEYPLRRPSREPLYFTTREARLAMGLEDPLEREHAQASGYRPHGRQLRLGRELPSF